MSYDLYLRDPATREELQVPAHMMFGGNVPCSIQNGQLVPKATTEAYLNITYNYGRYYYEAFPGVDRKTGAVPEGWAEDKKKYGITCDEGGINSLNDLSGLAAIPLLEEMIRRIEAKYKDENGEWISTERENRYVIDKTTGTRKDGVERLDYYFALRRNGMSDEEAGRLVKERYEDNTEMIVVNEGETGNYWTATAANAIRPLYQLIALSRMRPDGVWSEES